MDVMYPRCCGLDVHKKTVAACLITQYRGTRAREGDSDLPHDDRRPVSVG